jgi:hypothetical protein
MGNSVQRYLGYGYGPVQSRWFRGMRRPDLQYSAVSVREAKYTRLGYKTRLSKLHTLDPSFSISFSEE